MHGDLVARPFPVSPALPGGLDSSGGEVLQSLTYRESFQPYTPPAYPGAPVTGSLLGHAPDLLRAAAGGAWALVLITASGGLVVLLALLIVRVAGWLA